LSDEYLESEKAISPDARPPVTVVSRWRSYCRRIQSLTLLKAAMFKYFPTNCVWNLSVDLAIEMGAPLQDAAKQPDAAGACIAGWVAETLGGRTAV
jgi:hypothetical protein